MTYRHQHTYDILPESDSGAYFAGGVLIASTLTGIGGACNVITPQGSCGAGSCGNQQGLCCVCASNS